MPGIEGVGSPRNTLKRGFVCAGHVCVCARARACCSELSKDVGECFLCAENSQKGGLFFFFFLPDALMRTPNTVSNTNSPQLVPKASAPLGFVTSL